MQPSKTTTTTLTNPRWKLNTSWLTLEEEAKDINSKLDAGENFDELAKTSKDGSAQQGGSLVTFHFRSNG